MATTDSNGIVRVEASDDVAPLHTVLNSLAQSVSNAFDTETRIYPVANAAARSALVTSIGVGNITNAKPLFVWRADATTGRNLEYTVNGSTWRYYSASNALTSTTITLSQGGFSGTLTLSKDPYNLVRMVGQITCPALTTGTWTTIATVPSGFRIGLFSRFSLPAYAGAEMFRILMTLGTGGEIQVQLDGRATLVAGNVAYCQLQYVAAD